MQHPAIASRTLVHAAWASRLLDTVRRAWKAYLLRRSLAATVHILESLDDRTLKDIGVDRSEITSVVGTRCVDRRLEFDLDMLIARG